MSLKMEIISWVQVSRRPESKHSESKRPESSRSESNRPMV